VTTDSDTPAAPQNTRPPGLGGLLDRLPRPLRIVLPIVVVGVIALAIVLVQRSGSQEAQPGESLYGPLDARPPSKGEPAPDFALEALDGGTIRLSSLQGKPVVLNFWATWCGPCRAEMPDIQRAYDAAGGEVVVLAINTEGTPTDTARRLSRDFRDELGLTFPVLIDSPDNDVFNQYRLRGLPDTFFIDRDGVVRDFVVGPLSHEALEEKLADLLAR
jgi:thiol-disulfide isomerase/thioredoxin